MLGLCRHVFPHAESHKFFIEHWGTLFFNAIRKVGGALAENGFFPEADDIFYLNIHEVHEALFDVGLAWAAALPGGEPSTGRNESRGARRSSRRSPSGCRRRARRRSGGDQRSHRPAPLGRHRRAAPRLGERGGR